MFLKAALTFATVLGLVDLNHVACSLSQDSQMRNVCDPQLGQKASLV